MKKLKTILIAIYPILIVLLLLSNLRGCNSAPQSSGTGSDSPIPTDSEEVEDPSLVRQAEDTGNTGELKVTLLWNFQGDIDLHVCQPNGRTINYTNPKDVFTKGFLDVDDRNGGSGAAENIYWKKARPGKYKVFLEYYGPAKDTEISEFGICSVVVFQPGVEPKTYNVQMTAVKEQKNITEIIINR